MFHRPHIARVAGEAIDADQVFAPCDCGCDYHGHECAHADADGYSTDMPATDIARIMGWDRSERSIGIAEAAALGGGK